MQDITRTTEQEILEHIGNFAHAERMAEALDRRKTMVAFARKNVLDTAQDAVRMYSTIMGFQIDLNRLCGHIEKAFSAITTGGQVDHYEEYVDVRAAMFIEDDDEDRGGLADSTFRLYLTKLCKAIIEDVYDLMTECQTGKTTQPCVPIMLLDAECVMESR